MNMDDFIMAFKEEIGSVTWVITQKEFEKRIDKAILKIIQGIKEESIKII